MRLATKHATVSIRLRPSQPRAMFRVWHVPLNKQSKHIDNSPNSPFLPNKALLWASCAFGATRIELTLHDDACINSKRSKFCIDSRWCHHKQEDSTVQKIEISIFRIFCFFSIGRKSVISCDLTIWDLRCRSETEKFLAWISKTICTAPHETERVGWICGRSPSE